MDQLQANQKKKCHTKVPRRDEAAAAVERARAARPQSLAVQALARALAFAPLDARAAAAWRPPGVDPASARWALAEALALAGEQAAARELAAPLLPAFPELAPPGGR